MYSAIGQRASSYLGIHIWLSSCGLLYEPYLNPAASAVVLHINANQPERGRDFRHISVICFRGSGASSFRANSFSIRVPSSIWA